MIRAALIGTFLIHPILFLLVFGHGVVYGAKDGWNMDRAPTFGWQGGLDGMTNVLTLYLITMGLAPLIMSATGAALGAGACLLVRKLVGNRVNSTREKDDQPGPAPGRGSM